MLPLSRQILPMAGQGFSRQFQMTYAIFACTLWFCAPEPLRSEISHELCQALKLTMQVEGIQYKCERMI